MAGGRSYAALLGRTETALANVVSLVTLSWYLPQIKLGAHLISDGGGALQ